MCSSPPPPPNACEGATPGGVPGRAGLYMAPGREDRAIRRGPFRPGEGDELPEEAIRAAIAHKPKGHDFDYSRQKVAGQVSRHMSHTGG